jgi:hypothetical protein
MAEDAVYQDDGNQEAQGQGQGQGEQQQQGFSSAPIQQTSSNSGNGNPLLDNHSSYKYHAGRLVLSLTKEQLQVYEDVVFSIISKNNGKLRFIDILDHVGGPPQKNVLYKTLASLARQGRIERIRGIGKKRIEFYYYDSKKIKRPAASASVSFVST